MVWGVPLAILKDPWTSGAAVSASHVGPGHVGYVDEVTELPAVFKHSRAIPARSELTKMLATPEYGVSIGDRGP